MRVHAVSGIKLHVRSAVIDWGFPFRPSAASTAFEGRLPMKIEKYLLLVLVAFVLLVLGTFLHKMVH